MKRLVVGLWLALISAMPVSAEIAIQQITSPGGITAWLVEEHSIPFTALEIRFKGGTSLDADGKRGAINLMTGLLEEGAGEMDARTFAQARESLAAGMKFDVHSDALSISARFLSENRADAVALLKLAVLQPRFDQDAIDRVREQVLSIIRSDETEPGELASARFDKLAWGTHPYGSSGNGTLESVKGLVRDDIVDAYQRVFSRERVFVSAVGDIAPEALGLLIDDLLGGLPEKGADLPEQASYGLTGGVTVVPYDTPQSVARFGHRGIKRDDPDFFAAYVLNQILAGDSEARLMQELREKRGLTYGVSTFLVPMDFGELILGQWASDNTRMAEAVEIVRSEWARIANEGVTESELEDAKRYLTGAYPLRFDGNAPIARILVGMQMTGLSPDYVTSRNDKVMAVSLEDANRVARRIFLPDELRFVVVGQPEGLATTDE